MVEELEENNNLLNLSEEDDKEKNSADELIIQHFQQPQNQNFQLQQSWNQNYQLQQPQNQNYQLQQSQNYQLQQSWNQNYQLQQSQNLSRLEIQIETINFEIEKLKGEKIRLKSNEFDELIIELMQERIEIYNHARQCGYIKEDLYSQKLEILKTELKLFSDPIINLNNAAPKKKECCFIF